MFILIKMTINLLKIHAFLGDFFIELRDLIFPGSAVEHVKALLIDIHLYLQDRTEVFRQIMFD